MVVLALSPIFGQALPAVGLGPPRGVTGGDAGDQLEVLQRAQTAALAAGAADRILETSQALAAMAARLLGDLLREQGRPGDAATRYRQSFALASAPETQQALLTGEIAAGERAAALALAEEVAASAGDGAPLRMQLAAAFHAGGDLNGTIVELEHATAVAPDFAGAHLALGTAYWELNQFQYNGDSLREFTRAQVLTPEDYFANFDLGSVLSQYGRFAEATPYLKRAAIADASSPDPSLVMGMNAWAEQRTDAARLALERTVALTGAKEGRNNFQVRRAYAVLSRVSAEQGRASDAQAFASRADALRVKVVASGQVGAITESTGMTAAVAPGAVAVQAVSAGQVTTGTAMQAVLERELDGVLARSLNDAGTVLARERDYAGALPWFRQATAADAMFAAGWRNLGLAEFHVGAWSETVDALSRALTLVPGDALVERDLDEARRNVGAVPPAAGPPVAAP